MRRSTRFGSTANRNALSLAARGDHRMRLPQDQSFDRAARLIVKTTLVILFAMVGMIVGRFVHHSRHSGLRPRAMILFPDLPDGDCAIIRTPDRRTIVVDTGGPASGTRIASVLKRVGADQIDLLILASSTDSGVGGTPALLQSGIPIRSVWNNAVPQASHEAKKTIATIAARKIPYRIVHSGERIAIGTSALRVSVIWPPQHNPRATQDGLAIRVQYGSTGVLLLGPVATATEDYVVASAGAALQCDVLQVTDHGAAEGTSLEMLRRTAPDVAVISCSGDTPDPGVLKRLQSAGTGIWRTDTQGDISVTMDGRTEPVLSGSSL